MRCRAFAGNCRSRLSESATVTVSIRRAESRTISGIVFVEGGGDPAISQGRRIENPFSVSNSIGSIFAAELLL